VHARESIRVAVLQTKRPGCEVTVRVIGGTWRGRRLLAPAGRAPRPTGDQVREAIFDLLAARVAPPGDAGGRESSVDALPLAGHRVLDLFAGMGGLGIEALSRGAAACTFVERDEAALRALRANLRALGVGAALGRVHAADYRRALVADARAGRRYTLVFVDPPYAGYAAVEAFLREALLAVLEPGALVVVETARGQQITLPLTPARVKSYGDTQVAFLEAAPTQANGAAHNAAHRD
jgi:16S rRNA (guanine966-N2)-methyltransferase